MSRYEHVASYVMCCGGPDGEQPIDCYTAVGQDDNGRWYVTDGDDDHRDEVGQSFGSRAEAEAFAQEFARNADEAEPDEDAEDMQLRLLEESAGEATPDGEYCVYWDTVGDDSHVVARYASCEAAAAAAELHQRGLESRHPGGRLLCGYEVRRLEGEEWVKEADNDEY